MKAYGRMIIIIALIMALGIAVFAGITSSYRSHETDTLYVNDLIEAVRENWSDLDEMPEDRFDTEMIIFDSEGFIRYSTTAGELASIDSSRAAVHKGCLCLAVSEGSRFLGTIVIPDPDKAQYDLIRQRLIIAALLLAVIMLSAVCMYGVFVHRTIVKPFRKMEKFAVHVASGRLDEPLMLEKNNMFGAFTESFDIMREELKESRRRESAMKIKEKELVAALSHDLKTPITGIKLICELLTVKVKDDYVIGKIDSIQQKAEQIDVLVSDLLASSLEDIGEMSVSCNDESSAILNELVSEHDTRSLAVEEAVPECMINTDRSRLSQIIGNIISNSYKYANTRIDVSYRINGRYLEMSLKDHGVGVPEDEIGLITNKFYRGKTNSVGKDGNGLGLYIASELAAKMNGELVCSSDGKGLKVTIFIPLS